MSDIPCSEEECSNPSAKGGLCWAHIKRKRKGQTMAAPVAKRPESKIEVLREAALAYADAESDAEFRLSEDKLRKAAERFGMETAQRYRAFMLSQAGRRGGLATASKMTASARSERARKAGAARWASKNAKPA